MFSIMSLLIPVLLSATEAQPGKPVFLYSSFASAADTVVVTSAPNLSKTDTTITELIAFAKTLKGTRYKYASADPKKGFDCSGFVMYVFNHFQMTVPRSSVDFSRVGKEIDLKAAQPGDLILFTGTNSTIRRVGHVGIITQSGDNLTFIHASSGAAYSVTETTLTPHYKKRFVKVVRMLE